MFEGASIAFSFFISFFLKVYYGKGCAGGMPVGASCAIHAFRVGEGSARRFAVPGRRGGFRTSLLRPKGRNCIFFSSIFLEWVAMEERITHRFCVFFHRGGYRIFCFAPMGSYRIFRFSVFLNGLTMEGRLTHPSVGFSERMKVAFFVPSGGQLSHVSFPFSSRCYYGVHNASVLWHFSKRWTATFFALSAGAAIAFFVLLNFFEGITMEGRLALFWLLAFPMAILSPFFCFVRRDSYTIFVFPFFFKGVTMEE